MYYVVNLIICTYNVTNILLLVHLSNVDYKHGFEYNFINGLECFKIQL